MVSNINSTLPQDGIAAAKADLRANLAAAKAEIEALQTDSIQRANHTGTQLMATIADAGTLATKSTVLTADITDGNVSRTKIQNDAVDLTKLYHGTANRVLGFDGSGVPTEIIAGANITLSAGIISAAGGSAGEQPWDIKAFGATGNGTTDDTAAVQSAIGSGELVVVTPGDYSVNTLELPSNGADTTLYGLSPLHCRFLGRTAGLDILHAGYAGTIQARPGTGKQLQIHNLGFVLNTGAGADTSANFNRCTTSGYAIGAAAIALERTNFLNGNGAASISDAWGSNFGLINNCMFGVTTKFSAHRMVAFHSQCNAYGWTWNGMKAEGPHGLITVAFPFVRRVTANSTSDILTCTGGSGDNDFANGDQIRVRAHQISGTQPGGLSKDTDYFVVGKSGAGFQVSLTSGGAAVNITSAGSGAIYVIRTGPGTAVFSPDETLITGANIYSGPYGIGITNPERLTIQGYTSYANQTILEIDGCPSSASRVNALTCQVIGLYSESPQAADGLSTDPCMEINCDGFFGAGMQVRGADTGSRPIYRFRGENHEILQIDGRSNSGQQHPDVRFEAEFSHVTGQVHTSGLVSRITTGAGKTTGRLKKASASTNWFFDYTEA